MNDVNAEFIAEIFEIEAIAILSDISMCPEIFFDFINFNEDQLKNALSYVKNVLNECYKCGHLKVAISHFENEILGYAMLFTHPDKSYSAYLHKIYVHEKYRGNGYGNEILNSSIAAMNKITLLCASDKIEFYKKHGFSLIQEFETPDNSNFRLSKSLYSGLYVMSNNTESFQAPIFFLNDNDIKNIISA